MNFLELVQDLRRETGTAGNGPATVEGQTGDYARLVNWIAQAYVEIQNKWTDWKFLWKESSLSVGPAVSGNPIYSLAADCSTLSEDTLRIGDDELEFVPYDDYAKARSLFEGSGSGQPYQYTIRPDGRIRLFPSPDAAYTISYEYHRSAFRLASNTDVPAFKSEHDEAIIWRAKMYWAEFEEAREQYQTALTNFNLAMLRLEARYLPAPRVAHGRASGTHFVVRPV